MTKGKHRRATMTLVAGLAAFAAGVLGSSAAAIAAPDDPFTPQFSFSTSTTQAGANPDITVEMHKQLRNRCVDPPNPIPEQNSCRDQYIEQNVKRMTVHFPPGAVPDPNAVPYCDLKDFSPHPLTLTAAFGCQNEDALVGVVDATIQWCDLALSRGGFGQSHPDGCEPAFSHGKVFGEGLCPDGQRPPLEGYTLGPTVPPSPGYTYLCRSLGYVYNEVPRKDEHGVPIEEGHLVVLWPRWIWTDDSGVGEGGARFQDPASYEAVGGYYAIQAAHIGVQVRKSDLGLDSVAEIPDSAPIFEAGGLAPAQLPDIAVTLFGNKGAERGHPLLTNPTSCDPDGVDAEILGYAENSGPKDPLFPFQEFVAGSGDGKLVTASVPTQATGCDKVPFDPKLTIDLGSSAPSAAPAISSVVTQNPGEATTGNVEVRFPKEFKINDKNTATHCPTDALKVEEDAREDLPGEGCPESSRIGTVSAESPLLPEGEKLSGNVYLTGLTGDSVKISSFLKGRYEPAHPKWIDLAVRIDAEGSLGSDLAINTTFANLPQVPISRFELNLEGGDKGLIKNPKVCGPETIASTFTSHSGKQVGQQTPVDIAGCKDPVLDVELSNARKGEPTDLDASVSSTGTTIDSVELRLDRHMKWGKRKAPKGKKQLTQGGSATFDTLGGQKVVPLKAKATKRGGLAFGPLTTGRKGQRVETAVPGFTATLTRARGQGAGAARRDLSAFYRKSTVGMSGLPGDDPTAIDLSLLGQSKRRPIYLKNPLGCKKPLNFVAIVKTKRGATLALKDQVRLRGKGCKRRQRR